MERQEARLILYEPHKMQLAIHQSKARFRVVATGRQAGKSTCCLNELAFRAWENPGSTYWMLSPTFDQARIQYRRMVGMLMPCADVMLKKNQTELRVKLINQSQIVFKSGEVLDNLRGETLHGVVVDEVRDQHPELWSQVLRPMLATTHGFGLFVSTPRGFDSFYDLHQRGGKEKGWESFQAPSTCNPLFTQDEFEAARLDMSEAEFAQEILAEFRDLHTGKVYLNHGPHNQVSENPFSIRGQTWSPHLPIVIGLDFNVANMCWVIGQVRGRDIFYGDEIAITGYTDSGETAKVLAPKIAGHKAGVILIGDASGKARKSASSGETDYSLIMKVLRDHGITNVRNLTPESNPPVKDRVNIMNAALRDASGGVHLFYDPIKCPRLKKDFERVSWKQGTGEAIFSKTDPSLTHASDAAGYPVAHFGNQFKPKPGKLYIRAAI